MSTTIYKISSYVTFNAGVAKGVAPVVIGGGETVVIPPPVTYTDPYVEAIDVVEDSTGPIYLQMLIALTTLASTVSGAGLNLPHGAAPTVPVNGDIWTTTLGLYAQINGATVGPFASASALSIADNILDWDATNNWYAPYAAKTVGAFDVGTVVPSNYGRLNFDGSLYATTFRASAEILVGDAIISPAQNWISIGQSNIMGYGTTPNAVRMHFNPAITEGTGVTVYLLDTYVTYSNVATKLLSIGNNGIEKLSVDINGRITTPYAALGLSDDSYLYTNSIYFGEPSDTIQVLITPHWSVNQNGRRLVVSGGDARSDTAQTANGGELWLLGGLPSGTGGIGAIYVGTGSAGTNPLGGTGTGTSVLYYDRGTGQITYGDIGTGGGVNPVDSTLLDWDAGSSKYQPYASKQAGGDLYTGTTNPTEITRLNYNGTLHVTELRAVSTLYVGGGASAAIQLSSGAIQFSLGATTYAIFDPYVANSGTNVAYTFATSNALTGTTLLMSVRNQSTEKFSIADDGSVNIPTGATYNINGTPISGTSAVDSTLLDWSTDRYIAYASKGAGGELYTGTTNPDQTTRLNYNGYLYATNIYAIGGAAVGVLTGNHILFSTTAISIKSNADVYADLTPSVADGATAIAYTFDTANTLSTSGAKLVSFKNNGVEKAYLNYDGYFYATVIFSASDIVSGSTASSHIIETNTTISFKNSSTYYAILNPSIANTGSNVAYILDTANALTGSTLLLSLRNQTTQKFAVNKDGRISSVGQAEYADNAAAVSAGLAVGDFYRTGDVLKVTHA